MQTQEALSLDFAKWLACLAETNVASSANEIYLERYPHSLGASIVRKAAVLPGTTTDSAWAAPLMTPAAFTDAFIAIARTASLIGRIPGLRMIPFNTKIPFQTGDAGYAWVKQSDPKPVSKLAFSNGVTLPPLKGAGIVVLAAELAKLSAPGSEVAIRDTLIAGLTSFTDTSFLDPAQAAVTDKQPASVTNGTTPITNTGNLTTDVASLLSAFFAARPNAIAPVLIANAAKASAIACMNSGGGVGLPVVVSGAALGNVIAMDPAGVFVADGGVEIETSREAAIELESAPVTATAATIMTSLWQMNLIGYRVDRFLNYYAVPTSVMYLAG